MFSLSGMSALSATLLTIREEKNLYMDKQKATSMEVPCFRCLFMEDLKARACKPADCEELSQWLFREARIGYDSRMKHPKEIIQFAKTLSQKTDPAFSTRDIAALIHETFGIKVSHVAVNKWINS